MKILVNFFKTSGKWYTEETVEWLIVDGSPFDSLDHSLQRHFASTPDRLVGMILVANDVPDYCPILVKWNGQTVEHL